MRLLDLFCGAGGCAVGYHRAGFTDITGVDLHPQPRYPFRFVQTDALEFLAAVQPGEYDLIHASPPCQGYSDLQALSGKEYPRLVDAVRAELQRIGGAWVIENVDGAPLQKPVRLCGSSFGLPIWRHRLFEVSPSRASVLLRCHRPQCRHDLVPAPLDVTGTGGSTAGAPEDRQRRLLPEAAEPHGSTGRAGHRLDVARRAFPGHPARLHRVAGPADGTPTGDRPMTDVIAPYLPHSGTSLAAAQALTRERVARQAGEPEWLQPRCPRCEAPLRCRSYEAAGCGVVFIWECERSAGPRPACEYRRVLF